MKNKETTRTEFMLKILLILSWIIFAGVGIQAGGLITTAVATLLLTPMGASRFWQEVDLTNLYNYDSGYFFVMMLLMCIVAVMRSTLFYLIVRILHEKRLSNAKPFSPEVSRFISRVSYLSLGIGLFSFWGARYSEWLVTLGVNMPDIHDLHIVGADVWLFMGVTLLVIAQLFKRGIEIQSENELTV